MKFKTPPNDPPSEPVERDDVHVSVNRCPYCHDDVTPVESVACQDCLARHHKECWVESGACSSCGGQGRMERALDPLPYADGLRRAIASEPTLRRWIYGLGAVGVLMLYGVGAILLTARLFPFENPDLAALLVGLAILGPLAWITYLSAHLRLWGYAPPDPDDSDSLSSS